MTDASENRVVIKEIIELYSALPCLWDLSCKDYKNVKQKSVAWTLLVEKLKLIEPDANLATIKKKIDNLKYSYNREVKKVNASKKRIGSTAYEVHRPSLWYFDSMRFLNKNNKYQRKGVDTSSSDDDDPLQVVEAGIKRRRNLREKINYDPKSTTHDLFQQSKIKTSSFGVYVGEQLESLSTQQRQIAEKLISDVIFLGKTENLHFNSRIESPRIRRSRESHYITPSPPPQYISPSQSQSFTLSPQKYKTQHTITSQPHHDVPPQNKTKPQVAKSEVICIEESSSSSLIQSDPFPPQDQLKSESTVQFFTPSPVPLPPVVPTSDPIQATEEMSRYLIEGPAASVLRELLIIKKPA